MVSILSQIPPVQWKISDTFKIKKPVKSLRPEVIFAIINLIKLAALSDPGTGRAGTRAERVPCPNRAAGDLSFSSVRIQQHLHSCGREHLGIPPVLLCPSAVIFL